MASRLYFRPRMVRLLCLLLALIATALATAHPARAIDLTAGTEAELNAAIVAVNAAGAGTHTITLTADITLTDWSTKFDNPAATVIIIDGDGHTIDGGGNDTESILYIAAGTTARVRDVTLTNARASEGGGILNAGTLTVESSHITANEASIAGGGIYSTGQLTIIDTTISDNSAIDYGGGIALAGEVMGLTMQNSTLAGNEAHGAGGGLIAVNGQAQVIVLTNVTFDGNLSANGAGGAEFFAGDGGELTVTISNSRLVNNAGYHGALSIDSSGVAEVTVSGSTVGGNRSTAADGLTRSAGGGIYAMARTGGTTLLTLFNSTVSGNSTDRAGGGLLVAADGSEARTRANVVYSTLANNTAGAGGDGIHTMTANGGVASVLLSATIITNGLGAGPDCARPSGAIISNGFNLASDDTCFPIEDEDSDLIASEAGLLPLALNAPGTTPTHALSVVSPARDRIPPGGLGCGTAISADQRGVARPQPAGGRCDIGAFERRPGETPEFRGYLPLARGSGQ